ncbi:hypothetical protein [Sphaerisporangium sp. NPDC051011]|uniref:hypothetical protein n=1 Tax=Sphaerisporangium sp. NPDC051011 TaxID=3155792 RepID=UPI0033D9C9F8
MKEVATVVATVDLNGVSPDALKALMRGSLVALGVEFVPSGWAPDPDTIADLVEADRLHVIDLNA